MQVILLLCLTRVVAVAVGTQLAPLRVVSVTPSTRSAVETTEVHEVEISERQAITVSFNFAFIALGSDYSSGPLPDDLQPIRLEPSVPGHWRWVTTSILRFDPIEDWPAELRLRLVLRGSAKSYDGRLLEEGGQSEWRFRTPALRMYVGIVVSERATNLTDGRWDAGHWREDILERGPEVPPDGRVQLRFSSDVNRSLLFGGLRLDPKGAVNKIFGQKCAFLLGPCSDDTSRCVELIPKKDAFDVNSVYVLSLPQGSSFHSHAGTVHKELTLSLSGLRSFSFPFLDLDATGKQKWRQPSSRRHRLWLRHGLEEGLKVEDVASQFKLTPDLSFKLTRPEAAVLQLEAMFEPGMTYTLEVLASSSIKDGFGLPLLASSVTFKTSSLDPIFLEPGISSYSQDSIMFPRAGGISQMEWPLLTRGEALCLDKEPICKSPQYVSMIPVGPLNLQEALVSLWHPSQVFLPAYLKPAILEAPLHVGAEWLHVPLADLLKPTGLVLHTHYKRKDANGKVYKHSTLLGSPSLVAALAVTPDDVLTVWVLRASDNSAVVGADVKVYQSGRVRSPSSVTLHSSGKTDNDGLAHLKLNFGQHGRLIVVVQADGESLLVTDAPQSCRRSQPKAKGRLISDRAVYKPLDEVKLKVYVRHSAGARLKIPEAASSFALRAHWTHKPPVPVPVVLDAMGSFDAQLSVPADAQYGQVSLELLEFPSGSCQDYSCQEYSFIDRVMLTVADPRPPTVALKVVSSDGFLRPGGNLSLTVSTATLSGVAIAGADVKLAWTLRYAKSADSARRRGLRSEGVASQHQASGEDHIHTGVDGTGMVFWSPSKLPRPESVGDHLTLHFEWVGPTRELLKHKLEVPVANSKWTLALEVPQKEAALPGIPLSVTATLREHSEIGGKLALDIPVTILLYSSASPMVAVSDVSFEQLPPLDTPLQECRDATCELTLPDMGSYVAVACAMICLGDKPLCSLMPLGRTEKEWQQSPLVSLLDQVVSLKANQKKYRRGDKPELAFYNPLPKLRAFVKWGNQLAHRSMVTPELPVGHTSLILPKIGHECDGGCSIWIFFAAPGDDARKLTVPASPLFDVHGPQAAFKQIDLDIESSEMSELTVKITPDRAVQEPSSSAGFTISLLHADGRPATGDVCIFAVDQAFLNLQPHPQVNLSAAFALDLRDGVLQHRFSHAQLASAAGLNFSQAALKRILQADPWLLSSGSSWPLQPRGGRSLVETPLEKLLEEHVYDITEMPAGRGDDMVMQDGAEDMMMMRGGGPMMAMAASAPMDGDEMEMAPMMKSGSGGMAQGSARRRHGSGPAPHIRSNFVVTPLFRPSVSVKDGSAHVQWQLPDNTGSFELRAYAVSDDHHFGGGSSAQQVVRKALSLSPSMPRMARVGDKFKAGVTLTNAEDIDWIHLRVSIVLPTNGAVVLENPDRVTSSTLEQVLRLGAAETKEVVFAMRAVAIGSISVVVSVSDSQDTSANGQNILDSLKLQLQVLGVQPEVQVATSMSIPSSAAPCLPWQEGLVLPAAAKGSGTVSLTAGTGRLPAVQNLAAYLLQVPEGRERNANELLCAAAATALLRPYSQASPALLTRAAKQLTAVPAELAKLTTAEAGLHYLAFLFKNGPRASADLQLNAFALFVSRRLEISGVELPGSWHSLRAKWTDALGSGLESYAGRVLKEAPHKFSDFETLAACRLALGTSWQPRAESEELREALSMDSLLKAVNSLSIYSQAALCLLQLLPPGPTEDARLLGTSLASAVEGISKYFQSLLRVTARTAYVAQAPGSPHAASLRDNSMVLSALALGQKAHGAGSGMHTDKLANYVAHGTNSQSRMGAMFAAFGLVDYDQATESSAADVHFSVLAGTVPFWSRHLRSTDPMPATMESSWDLFSSPTLPLIFKAEGSGEVSVAVSLSFVPAARSVHPVYRGIDVQKVVQQQDTVRGGPRGPPLARIPLGLVVVVTLQITTVDDLNSVIVEDWLPAGLEALDPNLHDGHRDDLELSAGTCPPWLWWRCSRFERETKKDMVTFYSSSVYAGMHVLQYQAIAVTRGEFALPPTRASVVLEPEVMGLSGSGDIVVLSPGEVSSLDQADIASPSKLCPNDCMGRGTCDSTTGQCHCNAGSSGPDCAQTSGLPNMLPFFGGDEDDLLVLVNGDEEMFLDVALVLEGSIDALGLTWLFASDSSSATQAGGRSEPLVSVRAQQAEGRIALKTAKIERPQTTHVTVSASADGNFFASRRLTVQMYPECLENSSRRCRCPELSGSIKASVWGTQLCLGGSFGKCDCTAGAVARASKQPGGSHEKPQEDYQYPGSFYIILVVVVALCAWCFLLQKRRKVRRGGFLDADDNSLLDNNGLDFELGNQRQAQEMSSASSQAAYVDASELAE